jgi:hypothetical protein
MVLLTPEDFTDSVVKFNQDDKASLSKIRKIQRMLNENPENPDIGIVFYVIAYAVTIIYKYIKKIIILKERP